MSASPATCRGDTGRPCGPDRLRRVRGWPDRPIRATVVEAADDRDLFGSELSGSLCCGGAGQYRRQRFAGEAAPLAEVGGFADAPGGLGAADQRPFGHRMEQLAAQFFWVDWRAR